MSDAILSVVEWIRAAGAIGVLAYAVIFVAATVLLLPGSILTLAAGFAYGPVWGTLLVSPVSVAAAVVAFLLGRTIARRWIARKVERDPRFASLDRAIGEDGFKIVLLLRLSPVFPFAILNYALGLTTVRLRDYALASFFGMLPATILYVYLGSLVTSATQLAGGETADGGPWQTALYWGGLACALLVTVLLTRIARRALRHTLTEVRP